MSTSPVTTSMTGSLSSLSSTELCAFCQKHPYDLSCTCGDKFDFNCIHFHIEQMDLEFQHVQAEVRQRLLQVRQIIKENSCASARTIVDEWKRKRIDDINGIADDVLNQIQERENVYSNVPSFRVQYKSLTQESVRNGHDQLNSMIALQQQVVEKSDQLKILPELHRDDSNLDSKLQSKLNLHVLDPSSRIDEIEPVVFSSTSATQEIESAAGPPSTSPTINVPIHNKSITTSNTNISISTEPTIPISNENPTKESRHTGNGHHSTEENGIHDEFEVGYTANIHRRNPIIIPADNDKYAGTICCHDNQLLYNNYNQRSQHTRLTFISDIAQPRTQQYIDWPEPHTIISGGDDDWIQDMTYSSKLRGYLLLTRARLRLLHDDTHEVGEFYQFPDRSMKRVACNDTYMCLISASGITAQHGDEIVMLNYDKEEKGCKTFRDIIINRSRAIDGPVVGEISDLSISTHGQILVSYRLKCRSEVGVCLYNVSTDGKNWLPVKQLLLNEYCHNDLSYTPRSEWCEKLQVFVVIEYRTGHLIMLDQIGQVKGECRFTSTENQRESPLNISISNHHWLCARYESSIYIHRLENTRL